MATSRDLLLTDAGDLDLSGNAAHLSEDLQAIRQSITIHLKFFRGEWFLDEDAGLPYFQEVLIKNPQLPAVQSVFRAELLKVPGVASVESLSLVFTASTRSLVVTFRVVTDTGEILEGSI